MLVLFLISFRISFHKLCEIQEAKCYREKKRQKKCWLLSNFKHQKSVLRSLYHSSCLWGSDNNYWVNYSHGLIQQNFFVDLHLGQTSWKLFAALLFKKTWQRRRQLCFSSVTFVSVKFDSRGWVHFTTFQILLEIKLGFLNMIIMTIVMKQEKKTSILW